LEFRRVLFRSDVLAAEAGQQRGLRDRAVALLGAVDDERALQALQTAALLRVPAGHLAGAQQGDQRRGRRRVLYHAAELAGQAEEVPPPPQHVPPERRERGAGLPAPPELARAGAAAAAQPA